MYLLVLDGASSVAVSVSKNNHSASDVGIAVSLMTSGNGGSDASNLPSPNNSEEPLPPELHSAPVPAQVSAPHSVVTCLQGSMYLYVTRFAKTRHNGAY